MIRAIKLLSLASLLVAGTAFAFERGNRAYICYESNSGWMWTKEKHGCPVRVLERTDGSYRVRAERDCYFRKWREDDVFWLDTGDLWADSESDCKE